MTSARKDIMHPDKIETFHVYNRCVRGGFLLGNDDVTGKDYSHRKNWIPERLRFFAGIFCIDIVVYAIMENHFHLILQNRPDLALRLTPNELATRWLKLHPTKPMKKEARFAPTADEIKDVLIRFKKETLSKRFADISWFMRELDQYVAVKANKDDKCRGSFFESRFKSQLLADDKAKLTCAIYCDLNEIRSKLANSVENSFFTSAHLRSQAEIAKRNLKSFEKINLKKPLTYHQDKNIKEQTAQAQLGDWLAPFKNQENTSHKPALNITLEKYLELLDYTGREYHKKKPGIIPGTIAPILDAMDLDHKHWMQNIQNYGKWYYRVLGPLAKLQDQLSATKQLWFKGIKTWEHGPKIEKSLTP